MLDRHVLRYRVGIMPRDLDVQRVVDDQVGRHDWIDSGRISPFFRNRIAHAGEVNQRWCAEQVLQYDASRVIRKIDVVATIG
ncbi:hypothetical protein WS52_02190 [Burkholderia territorii]|nr:hypothetical protein WS52_02190 [Burkholderia territorii]KUZ59147.1 hypothetical protein WS53_07415 [Burkholderia territorii]